MVRERWLVTSNSILGGNKNRNNNDVFQPRAFTTYTRDGNASDEAMFRVYNRWWSRFDQPDPYDGSYNLTNPQSFNRYAYVVNDPVNRVDPTGIDPCSTGTVAQPDALGVMQCVGTGVTAVTVNIGGGQRSSGGVGASSGPIELETPTSPTEAELVPQNPTAPEDFRRDTFNRFLDDINRIGEIFGKTAKKIPTQTFDIAPALDVTVNGRELAKRSDMAGRNAMKIVIRISLLVLLLVVVPPAV
jgi:RHS repeat-associated protein